MRRFPLLLGLVLAPLASPASAREVVDASAPQSLAVTVYRDPERGEFDEMDRQWPRGFAMISETRKVTLPPGESTIRFEGVAEGMVAISAIVTGLPGGTIEKNRNAALLSPGALVDGTLGNRVRVTRTNPATGAATTESAIVRTRADGGLVLQTGQGFEAIRCAGLPERLTFDRVPAGLSAQPVYSVDTRDLAGGTYTVTLTYLAWGFDWQAHYVAQLAEGGAKGETRFDLFSWLTILNDNGQSFADAELMAVAGKLNIESDYENLADPPQGEPLRLQCYRIGSTAAGSPVPYHSAGIPAPAPMRMHAPATADTIVVTGSRVQRGMAEASVAVMAGEEQLGDLKLYRVPEQVTVAAKGLKQIAFLDQRGVKGDFVYRSACDVSDWDGDWSDPAFQPTTLALETVNDEKHGLGRSLPSGGITVFEPSSAGPLLIAENNLRDHAVTLPVEIDLAVSNTVMARCALKLSQEDDRLGDGKWAVMRAVARNAGSRPATVRFSIGYSGEYEYRTGRVKPRLKDGEYVMELTVEPGKTRVFDWKIRDAQREER